MWLSSMSRAPATNSVNTLPPASEAVGAKRKLPAEEADKAAGDARRDQPQPPPKRRRSETHVHGTLDGATSSTSNKPDSKPASLHDNDPARVETGDLLNGVGSASSLASTVSSVFSHGGVPGMAPHSGVLAQNHTLTPLTTSDSSPPGKTLSPRSAKIVADHACAKDEDAPTMPGQGSNVASKTITPMHTPPESRPQARPGPGEEKGAKLVWDPELDDKLSAKDKKRFKPKYKVFGVEVSLPAYFCAQMSNLTD